MQLNQIRPCDVILTRNLHESDNSSPGYWNHASLYVGDYEIVEAQSKPNKVILSDLAEFWNRYPEIVILRAYFSSVGFPRASDEIRYQQALRSEISLTARKIVGSPYRTIASLFRFLRRGRRGENCVSVIRKSFMGALSYDPGWRIPDDIMIDELFTAIGNKL